MKRQWANAVSEQAKREGVILRNIRESAGFSMRQLGMLMEGCSHTLISQAEHGKQPLTRYRQEQWVIACGQTVEDYDKMLGKKFQLINYKDELITMLRYLDAETIELAYKIIRRFAGNIDSKNVGVGGLEQENITEAQFNISAV